MQIKYLLSYLVRFLCCLSFFLLVFGVLLWSHLKSDFLFSIYEKEGYYEKLTQSIQEEMKNYILQSGLPEEVLANLYSLEDVQKNVQEVTKSVCEGETVQVSSEQVRKQLEVNIQNYLDQKQIEVANQESLHLFVDQIVEVYESEFQLYGYLGTVSSMYQSISRILKIMIPCSFILFVAFSFGLFLLFQKKLGAELCLTSGILFFIFVLFCHYHIDFKNLTLFDPNFSLVLRSVCGSLLHQFLSVGVFFLIGGVVWIFLSVFFKKTEL